MWSLSITASHQPPGTNLILTQFKEGGLGSFQITNYHSLGRTSNGHCRMQEMMGWLWWQGDLRTAACGGPGGEKRLERVRRVFLRWISTIPPCPCTACVEPKAISSVSKALRCLQGEDSEDRLLTRRQLLKLAHGYAHSCRDECRGIFTEARKWLKQN